MNIRSSGNSSIKTNKPIKKEVETKKLYKNKLYKNAKIKNIKNSAIKTFKSKEDTVDTGLNSIYTSIKTTQNVKHTVVKANDFKKATVVLYKVVKGNNDSKKTLQIKNKLKKNNKKAAINTDPNSNVNKYNKYNIIKKDKKISNSIKTKYKVKKVVLSKKENSLGRRKYLKYNIPNKDLNKKPIKFLGSKTIKVADITTDQLQSIDDTNNTGVNSIYHAKEYGKNISDGVIATKRIATSGYKISKLGSKKLYSFSKAYYDNFNKKNSLVKKAKVKESRQYMNQAIKNPKTFKSKKPKRINKAKLNKEFITKNLRTVKLNKTKTRNSIKDKLFRFKKGKVKKVARILMSPKIAIGMVIILCLSTLIGSVASGSMGVVSMQNYWTTISRDEMKEYRKLMSNIEDNFNKVLEDCQRNGGKIEIMNEGGAISASWKDVICIISGITQNYIPKGFDMSGHLEGIFSRFIKIEKYKQKVVDLNDPKKEKEVENIRIICKSIEDVMQEMNLKKEERELALRIKEGDLFYDLYPEIDFNFNIIGNTGGGGLPGKLDPKELEKYLENAPKTTVKRQKIIETALSLVGKVKYFWGGKSGSGWNENWGKPALVTAPGSPSTGTYRPYGLDCSGFVDWAYKTAGVGNILSAGGTQHQWSVSYSIPESELQPGDLVFNRDCSHVGLFLGRDTDGRKQFIHCSSSKGVTVNSYSGFTIYRRPFIKFE